MHLILEADLVGPEGPKAATCPRAELLRTMEARLGACAEAGECLGLLVAEVRGLAALEAARAGASAVALGALAGLLARDEGPGDVLALQVDGRLVVLVDGIDPDELESRAGAWIAAARTLRVPGFDTTWRLRLAVGFARSFTGKSLRFATLLRVAREGAAVARMRGGSTCVHTMLYDLVERELDREGLAQGEVVSATPVRREDKPRDAAAVREPEPEPASDANTSDANARAAPVATNPRPTGWGQLVAGRSPRDLFARAVEEQQRMLQASSGPPAQATTTTDNGSAAPELARAAETSNEDRNGASLPPSEAAEPAATESTSDPATDAAAQSKERGATERTKEHAEPAQRRGWEALAPGAKPVEQQAPEAQAAETQDSPTRAVAPDGAEPRGWMRLFGSQLPETVTNASATPRTAADPDDCDEPEPLDGVEVLFPEPVVIEPLRVPEPAAEAKPLVFPEFARRPPAATDTPAPASGLASRLTNAPSAPEQAASVKSEAQADSATNATTEAAALRHSWLGLTGGHGASVAPAPRAQDDEPDEPNGSTAPDERQKDTARPVQRAFLGFSNPSARNGRRSG